MKPFVIEFKDKEGKTIAEHRLYNLTTGNMKKIFRAEASFKDATAEKRLDIRSEMLVELYNEKFTKEDIDNFMPYEKLVTGFYDLSNHVFDDGEEEIKNA